MDSSFLKGKVVLVTGGTGSFGRYFVDSALKSELKKLIVFSRDEYKQFEMKKEISDRRVRFFLGDVRDLSRLQRAFAEVDVVVHAAALKQVPALEYNPSEAVKTNLLGSQNVIDAALDNKVEKVLLISTDKAVNPVSLYGATKLCAEKLFIAANAYRGFASHPFLSVVRYGNVIGSRGSLVEGLLRQKEGEITLTHADMTRFWMKLGDAASLVMAALGIMKGGEIFVPKVPSMKVQDLILALAPGFTIKTIGIRAGEKIHEALLTEDETRRTRDLGEIFAVEPAKEHDWWKGEHLKDYPFLPHDFVYTSDLNKHWLKPEDIQNFVKTV